MSLYVSIICMVEVNIGLYESLQEQTYSFHKCIALACDKAT
jgi:hypothetical protein